MTITRSLPVIRPSISVRDFIAQAPEQLHLTVYTGHQGLDTRQITSARIQKLGLGLAGYTEYLHPGRLQVVGKSETSYLAQLSPNARSAAIDGLDLGQLVAVLITCNYNAASELISAADAAGLPLLGTPLISSEAINAVGEFLQDRLAPRITLHAVLLEIYGLGVLLEGASGIGKSECALDLITRGHRFVSDDVVELRMQAPNRIVGTAPELLREHIEIRGLGIINIRALFGAAALAHDKPVALAIKLERWEDADQIDRLGLDSQSMEILGVAIPQVILPVSPGRNLSTLVETAVRLHLVKLRGYDGARSFIDKHEALMRAAAADDTE